MTAIGVPLFFKPLLMEKVWGGNRLGKLYGKLLPPGKIIGESWELVDRPEAQSVVEGGPFDGWTLRKLMEERGEALLGPELAARKPTRFPLLAKFVDAGEALSVQVHPDDDGAKRLGIPDRGKCECWVVVHAEPGNRLTRGLKPGTTRAAFEAALKAGKVEEVLHAFEVQEGDVLALPPGMIHAIGAGIVVAEIQQNSDLTFRVYDYNRMGLDGKPRAMHVRESLETISFGTPPAGFFTETAPRQNTQVQSTSRSHLEGAREDFLLGGKYFDLRRFKLAARSSMSEAPRSRAPTVLMCLQGTGCLGGREFSKGQTVLWPADGPALAFENPNSEPLVWIESQLTPEA